MRRQVITAAFLGLSLATTTLPAFADGDNAIGHDINTDGPGYDVRVDVDYKKGGRHTSPGGRGSDGRTHHDGSRHHGGGESIDGMSRDDAEAELKDEMNKLANRCKDSLLERPLLGRGTEDCEATPSPDKAKPKPKPDPVLVGRHAALQLTLPGAQPRIEPSPERNRWHSAAVGQALWLSVDDPTATKKESMTFMGQVVQLSARRNGLSFEMGDGNTVHCETTTTWSPSVAPGTPSPTCGYTYQRPAQGEGYKVTAISSWDVTWSVLGRTGTVHIEKAGGTTLPVGEVQSVVTRR